MYISIISAFTAENSARMIAMKAATDNAKEMIDRLTLQRNKVRQAAITKEILEIVTAGEALKG
jgi:F-type H+-transporting ATPase subunit gamma